MRIVLIITLILLATTACQTTAVPSADLPTVVVFPTHPPAPENTPTVFSTFPPTLPPMPAMPAMTTVPLRLISPTPVILSAPNTLISPSPTLILPTNPPANPAGIPTLLPEAFIFGTSVEGRELNAYRSGTGSQMILLVGGVHTGFETNTVRLLNELRDYYAATPNDILPDIALIFVPVLNPDGLQHGRQIAGRFNANGVDLNRNWGCGWSEEAVFRTTPVSAGANPFSEPETTALGSLIQQIKPAAVLFYHGAANGVFPGNCDRIISDALAQVYSAASGYPYNTAFGDYSVTGSAPAWVDSLGIPALDVELASAEETEFTRNLNAIRAVMAWVNNTP